jgi:hypothetical protein
MTRKMVNQKQNIFVCDRYRDLKKDNNVRASEYQTPKSPVFRRIFYFEAEKLPAKAFIIVWAGMYSSCLRSKLD